MLVDLQASGTYLARFLLAPSGWNSTGMSRVMGGASGRHHYLNAVRGRLQMYGLQMYELIVRTIRK